MKVEKLISHIRFMRKGDYVYSKERLYEKLNIENDGNIILRIGEIINYENNKYKIVNIQFVIIPGEWGLDYKKNDKILKVIEEEEDVSPTNSEILIEIEQIS
jgi:hypothetical protein